MTGSALKDGNASDVAAPRSRNVDAQHPLIHQGGDALRVELPTEREAAAIATDW